MTTERIADHVQFAYWVPNVSGGLVTSDIEQRTDWGYDYNVKLAQTAENNGFDYALSQVRTRPATAPSISTSPPASAWRCCWRRSGSR
jgi:alkanesulfonate monooxygenase SsuD/methylene tetrahydromethanopterin reductase-like flavin-dependent oxidoreductase (luciferase family)